MEVRIPMSEHAIAENTRRRAPRVSGESRYPNFDLENCLVFARTIKEQGGNACTAEQLGALLGYKNVRGGGFISRVAAAKLYGLISTVDGRYRITPLAETILYPVTGTDRQQALRDAFFSVPLYRAIYEEFRGTRLPEALGLDNFLRTKFGIPPGDRTVLARRVFLDSASQSGFFTATRGQRTHLTDPIIGSASLAEAVPPPLAEGGGNGGGMGSVGMRGHDVAQGRVEPLLWRLIEEIPPRGEPWPNRREWTSLWNSTLDFIHGKLPAEDGGNE
jgi:hypothetical protein